MSRKTAVITGASSGIGRAFSGIMARKGYDLYLVNHHAKKMEQVAQQLRQQCDVHTEVIIQDLAVPDAAQKVYDRLRNAPVDILINNAGFGVRGLFTTTDWEKEYRMIMVHAVALSQLTKLCLPGMIERGSGKILNMASMAAFQPGPLMAVYYATKAFVLSFSQAIASETAGTGVTVTALCPGITRTGFQKVIGSEGSVFRESKWCASPESVALYGYRAMMKGRTIAVPGLRQQALVGAQRFLPRRMITRVVHNLQRKVQRSITT